MAKKTKAKKTNKDNLNQSVLSRYGSLILLLSAFLLLILGLTLATFYYTNKITNQGAEKLALVGEQGEITQEIARIAFSQESYLTNAVLKKKQEEGIDVDKIAVSEFPQNTLFRRQEMKRLADRYTEIIARLEQGGEIVKRDGEVMKLQPVEGLLETGLYKNTKQLWDFNYNLISEFAMEPETGYLTRSYATYLMDYTRQYNRELQRDTQKVQAIVQKNIDNLRRELLIIQIVGVGLAVMLFLAMMLGVVRQLIQGDRAAAEARKETSKILETINEGLFLVDKDLNIGQNYSAHLENIIGQREIGGKSLRDVLAKLVDRETMEVTETFIEQLYSEWVVEDLISDLNPLRRIRVEVDDFSGYYISRYLDFDFTRVYEGEEIKEVLCSVKDITEAVLLEDKLAQERDQNDRQIEMLGTILSTEPAMLENFINTAKRRTNDINSALRRPERNVAALQDKAKFIFREIHSMKGEASALKLTTFVSQCENFESKVKELQNNPRLSGNDFLDLTVMLDELISIIDVVANLNDRISGGRGSAQSVMSGAGQAGGSARPVQSNVMQKYFTTFARDIAERNGKKVQLFCQGMDDDILSGSLKDTVQEIAVQMLRNAVVHGIETPIERVRDGKAETGNIQMTLSKTGNNLAELVIADDGAGIRFDKIRQKLLESGQFDAHIVQNMSQQELVKHIFDSGLSTAEQGNEDAGRGVGMDIVKERIVGIHGKLRIGSKEGQGTKFVVNFPLA